MNEEKYCTHKECRLDTLAELQMLYEMKNRGRSMTLREVRDKWTELSAKEVRCRHMPRETPHAAIQAPLPPTKE